MVKLPTGHTFVLLDDEKENAQVLQPSKSLPRPEQPGRALVRAAMDHPYGDVFLKALAEKAQTCTIIISDHTRPVPSRDILPEMLSELRAGNPEIEITLLVATGCHRGTTDEELRQKLGNGIFQKERIVVHDAQNAAQNICIGTLPSGAPLILDRLAVETDLLISEGFIEPHFFAGFSGGRKSVLPGVCDRKTVLGNHCGTFIADPNARTGMLTDNPIHRDMMAASEMAKLRYIVNVVIDEEQKTAAAFAGDPALAHAAGCTFLSQYCEIQTVPMDIVVTTNGGAPLDQNLYQCVKCMTAAEAALKPGGVVIVVAGCEDGIGGDSFYRSLRDCESPAALYRAYAETPQGETIPDQWQSQILARILMAHPVIMVTKQGLRSVVREMKMLYAETLEEALTEARRIRGADASLAVIPNGVSVMVRQGQECYVCGKASDKDGTKLCSTCGL